MAKYLKDKERPNTIFIGLDSSAIFDMTQDLEILATDGLSEYRAHMKKNEKVPLKLGHGAEFLKHMNDANNNADTSIYCISLYTNDDTDTAIRVLNSLEHYGLEVSNAFIANGAPMEDFIEAYGIEWFSSSFKEDVDLMHAQGVAANLVDSPLKSFDEQIKAQEIHSKAHANKASHKKSSLSLSFKKAAQYIWDMDRVIFDGASDDIAFSQGFKKYAEHEREKKYVPLGAGPFMPIAQKLSHIANQYADGEAPIIQNVSTRRGPDVAARVMISHRHYGLDFKGSFHFAGTLIKEDKVDLSVAVNKGDISNAIKKSFGQFAIFFDDSKYNVDACRDHVLSGLVPREDVAKALGEFTANDDANNGDNKSADKISAQSAGNDNNNINKKPSATGNAPQP
jgi:5'-nucleotidase